MGPRISQQRYLKRGKHLTFKISGKLIQLKYSKLLQYRTVQTASLACMSKESPRSGLWGYTRQITGRSSKIKGINTAS